MPVLQCARMSVAAEAARGFDIKSYFKERLPAIEKALDGSLQGAGNFCFPSSLCTALILDETKLTLTFCSAAA